MFHFHHTGHAVHRSMGMTEGPIWKQLLLFSAPLLVGNLFQQMYNTVDSIVVGNYIDDAALAAVGTSSTIISMLVGFFLGMATGASVLISQAFGAGEKERLNKSVHASIVLSLVLGVVITVAGILLSPTILRLINTDAEVFDSAVLYLQIYFAGILSLVIYNMGSAILRAIGDSRRPLYFLVVSSLVNVALDLYFVIELDMRIAGVAWATLIAQTLSAVLVMVTLFRSKEDYAVKLSELAKPSFTVMKRILSLGLPAGLQNSIVSLSNVMVNSYINIFKKTAMAGFTSYGKVDAFVMLPAQSLSLAVTTFVGQNMGARKLDRAKRGTMVTFLMSIGITAVLSVALVLFGNSIIGAFSPEKAVVDYGRQFLSVFAPFYSLLCVVSVYSGALRGAGDTMAPMIAQIACFVVLRQIYLSLGVHFGVLTLDYISFCYPVTWAVAAAIVYIHYRRGRWTKRAMLQ